MWYDKLIQNNSLKQLYRDVPALKDVEINKISLKRDGEEVALKEGYMHGNINISSQDGNLKINISGNLKCSFVAETAVIQRFSAYLKENIDT